MNILFVMLKKILLFTSSFSLGNLISQFVDESSDTLFTVSSDRIMRLWDLTSIKKSVPEVGRQRSKRGSFLTSKSAHMNKEGDFFLSESISRTNR